MVILVSVIVITIALVAVVIGKWLKRISERYDHQNDERLARFKEISDNLTKYINGKKREGTNDE